jgi:hypothetical protein
MQITGKRIFTCVMLVSALVTGYRILRKPQPVALPQNVETARQNAESFERKLQQLETSQRANDPSREVRFSSDEVNAEIAQSTGSMPAATTAAPAAGLERPASEITHAEVEVKGYQVMLEGSIARGQFITNVAGKDIYVTVAGHLGSQDGYATFDPTEFKVGEMIIPVSLVNPALQKKLAEQRDRLKLPDGIQSLRIERGELVITPK